MEKKARERNCRYQFKGRGLDVGQSERGDNQRELCGDHAEPEQPVKVQISTKLVTVGASELA